MVPPLIRKLKKTILENHLMIPGDRVLVGVSGGKDSICLLHAMNHLKGELQCEVLVAHVNHHLRGDQSDGDAKFVKSAAENLNLSFFERDVNLLDLSEKVSLEAWLRGERYRLLFDMQREASASKIALAHTQMDQAETLLMRLLMGSGPRGMKGMRLIREDGVIRPFLHISQADVLAYLREHGISYREDQSNEDSRFIRNRLRNTVIPVILESINPGFEDTLSVSSTLFGWNAEFLKRSVEEFLKMVYSRATNTIDLNQWRAAKIDKIIQWIVLDEIIKEVTQSVPPRALIFSILSLIQEKQGPWRVTLPKGFVMIKKYDKIEVRSEMSRRVNHSGRKEKFCQPRI